MTDKLFENKVGSLIEEKLVTSNKWTLSEEEEQRLTEVGRDEFIIEKILSRRYRKSGIDNEFRNKIREKVFISIQSNIPIKMILPFGGYKTTDISFQANWAEFFNFATIIEYVSPIADLYSPGVVIEYCSDGIAMGILNNIPSQRILSYTESFTNLLSKFTKNLPYNISINFSTSKEHYDNFDLFWSKVESRASEISQNWFSLLDDCEKINTLKKAERNFCWDGNNNFTMLNNQQKRDKLINSICLHNAYVQLDDFYRYEFIQGRERIPISTRRGYEGWLHLGSCRASVVQFWVGQGIIDNTNNNLIPKIFSIHQIRDGIFLNVDVKELYLGKNFSTIQVITAKQENMQC